MTIVILLLVVVGLFTTLVCLVDKNKKGAAIGIVMLVAGAVIWFLLASATDRRAQEAYENSEAYQEYQRIMDDSEKIQNDLDEINDRLDTIDSAFDDEIEIGKTKSYESVLEEYSQKIKDAVPGLIDEYNAEAAENTEGMEGLAAICNDKISVLAGITNDGIQEMARIMLTTGSGNQNEYEEWASKLQDVYSEEANKITDAYIQSATN